MRSRLRGPLGSINKQSVCRVGQPSPTKRMRLEGSNGMVGGAGEGVGADLRDGPFLRSP